MRAVCDDKEEVQNAILKQIKFTSLLRSFVAVKYFFFWDLASACLRSCHFFTPYLHLYHLFPSLKAFNDNCGN